MGTQVHREASDAVEVCCRATSFCFRKLLDRQNRKEEPFWSSFFMLVVQDSSVSHESSHQQVAAKNPSDRTGSQNQMFVNGF